VRRSCRASAGNSEKQSNGCSPGNDLLSPPLGRTPELSKPRLRLSKRRVNLTISLGTFRTIQHLLDYTETSSCRRYQQTSWCREDSEGPGMHEDIPSKQVSPQRLQANRANAKRSTGPRTARGKRNSSRNALKHGLLSKDLVIGIGEAKENVREFQRLLSELAEDLQPVGRAEESLVEIVASCDWRFRRALRAEAGEIMNGFADEERHGFHEVDRNLPGVEATEKILRYQNDVLRQKRHAMDDLEKLQRRRGSRAARNNQVAEQQEE
jgi:hypothetical protein